MSAGYAEAPERTNTDREHLDNIRLELSPHIARTALYRHANLGNGVEVWVKDETTQPTGSFKLRSMVATMLEAKHGTVVASAGNAGAALAKGGALVEQEVTVVVTTDTPEAKKANIRQAGGDWVTLVEVDGDFEDAQQKAVEISETTDSDLAQPFDSKIAIRGVATMGAEIIEELPDVNRIFVAVGGGSGVSGLAAALKAYQPDGKTKIVGVQYAGHDSGEKSFYNNMQARTDNAEAELEIVEATHIDELKLCDGSPVRKFGRECLSIALENPDRIEFMTVTATDVGAAIEDEIARRYELAELDSNVAFTPFPETTGIMAEAGAAKYKQLHPGIRNEKWVAVRSGANADPAKIEQAREAFHTAYISSPTSGSYKSDVAGGHVGG